MGSYSDGAVKKRIKDTGLPYIDISKNDYKYLEEIISLEKEENLRLIIKN